MPAMTTTRLPYTDYYLTIRREWENSMRKLHYIKPCNEDKVKNTNNQIGVLLIEGQQEKYNIHRNIKLNCI